MGLHSFRELLNKKAGENKNLQDLISMVGDEFLVNEIIESLEKMAASKGDKANSALTHFAGSATGADVNMLHDAISHHLSHFAAHNAAKPPKMEPVTHTIQMTDHSKGGVKQPHTFDTTKVTMDPIAEKHLETAMHLADLAARASKHSLGKLNFDHVPTQAWEMNHTSNLTRKDENGRTKYADDQQGLKRRPSKGNTRIPNHGYLLLNPHEGYQHKSKLRGHEGQYPFEEMKINDKHVVIDPDHYVEKDKEGKLPDKYVPHEFESHPLMKPHKTEGYEWERTETPKMNKDKTKQIGGRTDADREDYIKGADKWLDHDQFNAWLDKQDAHEKKDKEAYAARGKKPSKLLEGVKKGSLKEDSMEAPVQSAESKAGEHPRATQIRAKAKEESPQFQQLMERYIAGDKDAAQQIDSLPEATKKKMGVM